MLLVTILRINYVQILIKVMNKYPYSFYLKDILILNVKLFILVIYPLLYC